MFSNITQKRLLLGILLCVCAWALPLTLQDGQGIGILTAHAQAAGGVDLGGMATSLGLWLGNLLLSLGAAVAGIGGLLFDLSIEHFVLKMGWWLTEGGIGLAINNAWTVVRDIVNLMFIFGFVYIGIRTILDPQGAGYRKFLAQLIIAALLVNFSLFFTKVVIDVANIFALEINQLMDRGEGGNIGATIASQIGISGFYATVDPEVMATLTDGWSTPAFFFMATLFLLITGVTLGAAAIMIVVRFVALIFIMIASPLYFAARLFPQAAKFAGNLDKQLFAYAFYAPVFLFLIYVSLRILSTNMFSGGETDLADIFGGKEIESSGATVILQFFMAIALIIMSLRIAKSFSMFGATAVVGGAEKLMKNVAGGIAGVVGRNTVGRFGEALAKRTDEDRKSAKPARRFMAGASRMFGIEGASKAAANAKFGSGQSRVDKAKEEKEVKNGIVADKQKRALAASIQQGGVTMERAVADASNAQILDLLKDTDDKAQYEAIVGAMSSSQYETLMKEKDENFDAGKKAKLDTTRRKTVTASIEGTAKENDPKTFTQLIKNASVSQLEVLGTKKLEQHVVGLTGSQMDDLKKKLTEGEFRNLSQKREAALKSIAQGQVIDGITKADLIKQKPGDLAKLPGDVLKALARDLPVQALSKIVQDGTLNEDDQRFIKNEILSFIQQNPMPSYGPPTAESARADDYRDWLDNNNIGKTFGK